MKTILHFISTQHRRTTECYTQDPSGYEKCVSMCQKSIENLVSLLEEEEAAEARRRPKVVNTISILSTSISISILYISTYLHQVVKLPDPTIFTITSPSQETSYFYTVENLCSNFRVCSDDVSKSKLFVKV